MTPCNPRKTSDVDALANNFMLGLCSTRLLYIKMWFKIGMRRKRKNGKQSGYFMHVAILQSIPKFRNCDTIITRGNSNQHMMNKVQFL